MLELDTAQDQGNKDEKLKVLIFKKYIQWVSVGVGGWAMILGDIW